MERKLKFPPSLSLFDCVTGWTVRWGAVALPPVRALSFWLAIALPWLLLGLILAGSASRRPMLFGGLLAMTFVCALVGHDYRSEP